MKTTIKPIFCLQLYTWKQQMGHLCQLWERWPSIFALLILNFYPPSLCVTNHQKTDFLFGINIQKKYPLSYCCDLARQLFIQREGSFLTYTRNSEQHHNITVIKSTLKIPPRHNGSIPIKSKGHDFRDHIAYFISNQHTKNGTWSKHPCNWWYLWHQRQIDTKCLYCKLNQQTCHLQQRTKHKAYEAIHWQHTRESVKSIFTQKMLDEQVQLETFKTPFTYLFPKNKTVTG